MTCTDAIAKPRGASLLDLPAEIRCMIYGYLLSSRGEICIGSDSEGTAMRLCNHIVIKSKGLLRASKVLYEEFSVVLYSHTIFDLEDAADSVISFLRNTPDHLLACIRCIQYNHRDALPLTDNFPKELRSLMTKPRQDQMRTSMQNVETIFELITKKMTGLEALLIRLPIFSGRYHGVYHHAFQEECRYDPYPFVETLCQIRALDIPYVSLKLFTVCAKTHPNHKLRRSGFQCFGFSGCGSADPSDGSNGRAEWMEDMIRGSRKMKWNYLWPLLKLEDKDEEDEILFELDQTC